MTIAIRPANAADVPVILRFVRELADYEKAADQVVATEALLHEAMFEGIPAAEAVIAEQGGSPIGLALYFFNFSTWSGMRGLYLEDLYITPEARGSGAGTALLRHLAEVAIDRGCARFDWSVLDWNTPALDFYKSMGAVAMTEWQLHRVSGDALVKLAGRG